MTTNTMTVKFIANDKVEVINVRDHARRRSPGDVCRSVFDIGDVAERSLTRHRDIPAAALTAFARSEDRTEALERGFEMHLAKPVDPGELVASIATLVRRRSRGR